MRLILWLWRRKKPQAALPGATRTPLGVTTSSSSRNFGRRKAKGIKKGPAQKCVKVKVLFHISGNKYIFFYYLLKKDRNCYLWLSLGSLSRVDFIMLAIEPSFVSGNARNGSLPPLLRQTPVDLDLDASPAEGDKVRRGLCVHGSFHLSRVQLLTQTTYKNS